MSKKKGKLKRALALLLVNVTAIVILLYTAEIYLFFADPLRRLPVDGFSGGKLYTWGHEVANNRYGFREREFAVPKDKGVFRVMVLGDSFTWGAGLALEQRYTNVLEGMLKDKYPGRMIEVLNFGLPGGPTVRERDILRAMGELVGPDVVVVGFCLNDTQPRSQHYSVERARFDKKYGVWVNWTAVLLGRLGLSRLGVVVRKAAYRLAESTNAIPRWQVALARTYEPDSREWREFVGALGDIKGMCDDVGLGAPIFAVLNQGTRTDGPSDYAHPDDELRRYLDWYDQAEAAAVEAGFVTCNYEREIAEGFSDKSLAVNVADVHPSAELNGLYAAKLFGLVAARLEKAEQ